ncbi:MAG: HTTM domain-containing protein [Isosphaeraceae bacterium]|nr:HTTM domain-containing protein [Isosphaeraceae bacterium]
MHRLPVTIMSYFANLVCDSTQAWRKFFFTPADPRPLGLIRIIVGSLVVWDLATLGPDLKDYLGSNGWIGPEALRQFLAQTSPGAWSFWLVVPDRWLMPVWVGCLIVATIFTLGLATRTSAILVWVIALSTARRAPVTLFGFDQMNATWILYLAVTGASGQALSLDRFLATRRVRRQHAAGTNNNSLPRPTVSANIGLRLIQLHLAIVYGSSGLSKLMGVEWWNGTALEMILLTPEFRRLDPAWFFAHRWLLQLATHAALALEISYPVLIWVRPLRPLLLAAVFVMHVSIALMLGLTEFSLVMMAANLAFVTRRPHVPQTKAASSPVLSPGRPRGKSSALRR